MFTCLNKKFKSLFLYWRQCLYDSSLSHFGCEEFACSSSLLPSGEASVALCARRQKRTQSFPNVDGCTGNGTSVRHLTNHTHGQIQQSKHLRGKIPQIRRLWKVTPQQRKDTKWKNQRQNQAGILPHTYNDSKNPRNSPNFSASLNQTLVPGRCFCQEQQ